MPRVKVRQERNAAVEEKIRRALEKREREGTSFQDLATEFDVPRSTLNDRARGGKSRQKAHEEEQALPPAIEKALEKWALKMDDHGFPPRLDIFKAMAKDLAEKNAEQMGDPKLAKLGKTWLQRFLNRHPNVSSKFGSNLDRQRALAGNPGPIIDYFRKLKKALKQYNFLPENIYNMDEKGFILGMSSRAKVICRAGRRPPRVMQDGTRELITVIETICASTAAQFILPPMVIYKGAAHYRGWYTELGEEEGDADAIFAYSPKGYTTNELGMAWLQHFDTWTRDRSSGKFRLLLLDGHRSHYNLPFCRYAYDRKIILMSYPGHSTHLLQPLDVGLFAPLQKAYGKAASDFIHDTRTSIAKGAFWKFYRQAKKSAYTKENIKGAWRGTGIHPFNPDAVLTKLPGYKRSAPLPSTTPQSYKFLNTPHNRRDLRQQTLDAIAFVRSNPAASTDTTIALLRRLAHQSEAAMTRADIESIEKQDIRRRYAGKQAPRASRKKLTAAVVVGGQEIMKLESEHDEKERLQVEKAARNAMKGKKGKAKAEVPTKRKVPKGHRGDPIQVDSADDMESDREWDDIEVEAVPLTTGRTLGMTLRPRRGGCDGGGGNDGLESG